MEGKAFGGGGHFGLCYRDAHPLDSLELIIVGSEEGEKPTLGMGVFRMKSISTEGLVGEFRSEQKRLNPRHREDKRASR